MEDRDKLLRSEIEVRCQNCGWINEKDVYPLNIVEDILGRDILTFRCPACKMKSTSLRRRK